MAIFSDMPNELIICTWGYVIEPEDVESFALVSKRIYSLAKPFVEEHTRLKQQYSKIVAQRGYSAADLLKEILLNPRIAFYIIELRIGDLFGNGGPMQYSRDKINLFTKVIRPCSFIAPSEVTDWVTSLNSGDTDPICALIVVRLTKLKKLEIHGEVKDRLLQTLDRVTQSSEAYIHPGSSVFSCLSDVTVCIGGFDTDQVSRLLWSMKGLKSFSYFRHYQTSFEPFQICDDLLKSSQHSLQRLSVLCHSYHNKHMEGFARFKLLAELKIDSVLFLGNEKTIDRSLADALPPSIERVYLQSRRAVPSEPLERAICQMVGSKMKRLPKLKALTFESAYPVLRDMELITQLVGKCADVGILLSIDA